MTKGSTARWAHGLGQALVAAGPKGALPGHPKRLDVGAAKWLKRPDDVQVAYRIHQPHASGLPLMLIHGFAATAGMWDTNIDALSVDRLVIVWNQRGLGNSESPQDPGCYTAVREFLGQL